jgi:hypothetical protein
MSEEEDEGEAAVAAAKTALLSSNTCHESCGKPHAGSMRARLNKGLNLPILVGNLLLANAPPPPADLRFLDVVVVSSLGIKSRICGCSGSHTACNESSTLVSWGNYSLARPWDDKWYRRHFAGTCTRPTAVPLGKRTFRQWDKTATALFHSIQLFHQYSQWEELQIQSTRPRAEPKRLDQHRS